MKIYKSESHKLHNPEFEVYEGGLKLPIFDVPPRIDSLLATLAKTSWAELLEPEYFGLDPVLAVHDADYVSFLQSAFTEWETSGGELGPEYTSPVLLPASFPPRRSTKIPKSLFGRCGYYSLGTNAPIVNGTFKAAFEAAQCAVSAAKAINVGSLSAFAACRPPGHHAGIDYCGGYCYFNNAAIAAKWLVKQNYKCAILDIDFHAGNGTQDIFYDTPEVLTLSIHANPMHHFPSFMGYQDERGSGEGLGYHYNFPLPSGTGDADYLMTLKKATAVIREFKPTAMVVSLGLDICEGDPTGNFTISVVGLRNIAEQISELGLPVVFCLEGGYNLNTLGLNVITFLEAFL